MTSVASLILDLRQRFGKKSKAKHKQWNFWTGIAVAFFMGAVFLAWQDLHRQLVHNLSGNIDRVEPGEMTSYDKRAGVWIMLTVSIRNKGAPTIAENFELKIYLADGTVVNGQKFTMPDKTEVNLPDGRIRIVNPISDGLDNKTAHSIPQGDRAVGILLFHFPKQSLEMINKPGTKLELSFIDINKQKYYSLSTFTGVESNPQILHFPGLQPPQIEQRK